MNKANSAENIDQKFYFVVKYTFQKQKKQNTMNPPLFLFSKRIKQHGEPRRYFINGLNDTRNFAKRCLRFRRSASTI